MKRTGNRAAGLAQSLKIGTAIASALFVAAAPTPAEAMVQERTAPVRLDIPPQDLGRALATFARQTGQELLYSPELVAGRRSGRVAGRLSPREGLRHLLAGSGIGFVASPGGAFLLSDAGMTQNGRANPAPGEMQAGGAAADESGAALEIESEDIVVTAQKREERLLDTPVPVTAISSTALTESGQTRLQDYFSRVPGMNFQAGSRSEPIISIRGINSLGNPTVGITLDDLPFGPTLFRGGGFTAPDIDPSDLARIEVLRGPQGTLYGVASLGGLIKYVTADPSTARVRGEFQAGISSVSGGEDIGYHIRGSLNLPLDETVAVRVSGFSRTDPGYIDNPALNLSDVNRGDAAGGRVAMLWRPSESFSLRLSALYQERETDGANLITRSLGGLNQNYLRGSGWFRTTVQAYSAAANGQLGPFDVTSLTGFNVFRFNSSLDTTAFYGSFANSLFGVGGAPYVEDYETSKFTQELRVASSIGDGFDWRIGGFYTRERFTRARTEILAVSTSTGLPAGLLGRGEGSGGYEEYAVFGDAILHLTDRLDVQVGGRWSHNRQTYAEVDSGPLYGGTLVIPKSVIEESPFTFLFSTRYRLTPDLMAYARLASGYRAGGININAARGAPVPLTFNSDRTYNYEIGAKGELLNGALTFDVSAFYIDWRDLQINLRSGGANYQDNAGRARSKGIELALAARPAAGTTISGTLSYNDAELARSFGPTSPFYGRPGDALPFTSRYAGSISVDKEIPISERWTLSIGGTAIYVGDRRGLFQTTPVRQEYPDFTQLDLRSALTFEDWRISITVTNVTNSRGLIGGGIGQTNPSLFAYIEPRTAILSVTKAF